MQNQSQNPFSKIDDQFEEIRNLISNLSKVHSKKEPEEDLVNLKGACKILKLAPGTIYNKKKEIPHFKRGKILMFSKTDLVNYIKEGKIKTKTEIQEEVNQTLCNLKKDKRYTLPERVKKCTSTIDIENQTPAEASSEAGEIHFNIYKDELKKDIE